MTHRDPTSEAANCSGCRWKYSLWGMQFCGHPKASGPTGSENMRGCLLKQRKITPIHEPGALDERKCA